MKQPKTTEEFMALPVRPRFKFREEVLPSGRTIRRPVMVRAAVIPYESDTVVMAGGYVLGVDDEGLCRHEVLL